MFKTGLISLLVLVSVVSWSAAVDAGLPGDHAGKSGSKNSPKGASGGKGDASGLGGHAEGLSHSSAASHAGAGQGKPEAIGKGLSSSNAPEGAVQIDHAGDIGSGNAFTGNAVTGNVIAGNNVNAHLGPTQINAGANVDVDINGVPVVTVESYPMPSLGSVTLYMGDITVPLSSYSGQGNALWIEGSAGRWTQYATTARNVGIRLVAHSPAGGQAEIYETYPGSDQGMYTVGEHAFAPGYNRVTVGMSDPGRHVFFFIVENQASSAVVVDVI